MTTDTADWCVSDGNLSICGTRMVETQRHGVGERWCFGCRQRREFVHVVMSPDGPSYYGPHPAIRCATCNTTDSDLFPGRYREWDEDR